MTHTNGTSTHGTGGTTALKILVVGAGIGGLTAAIALRNQGHDVEVCNEALAVTEVRGQLLTVKNTQIYEQSLLATETGAAVHLAPNANGLLRRLGIFAEEFGANRMERVNILFLGFS